MAIVYRWSHAPKPSHDKGSDHFPAPMVMKTSMEPTRNPINGKEYTCMRAFERDVRAMGCEIAGNDSSIVNAKPKEITTPPGLKEDIAMAWDQTT
jgi:hypothetical protein